jgi:hypothetical protein
VTVGSYFGQDVTAIVERLRGEQMADGGWNCEQENGSTRGSFHTTINVLEGLLEHERATGRSAEVTAALERGQEYLLERRMLRRLSSGELIDTAFTLFSFPTGYHYDALRGLDYLRAAGVTPDARVAEAIDLVRSKRDAEGRLPLENPHESELVDAACWTGTNAAASRPASILGAFQPLAARLARVGPDVDVGRFDAQARQSGADLAAVVGAVVDNLKTAPAEQIEAEDRSDGQRCDQRDRDRDDEATASGADMRPLRRLAARTGRPQSVMAGRDPAMSVEERAKRPRSGHFAGSRRVGAPLLNNAAASLATAVPSKKRGFCVPHNRTAFAKTKSRKSSSVMWPASTSSKASGSGSRMSTTSKCPISEL